MNTDGRSVFHVGILTSGKAPGQETSRRGQNEFSKTTMDGERSLRAPRRWERRPVKKPYPLAPREQSPRRPQIGEVFNPNGLFNGIWVPESLLKCAGISTSAKLLYGRLARFAGTDGRCFPAVETLAGELGMADRQVQRLLAQLCGSGFLRKDAQYRPNGSQTANAYVFLYHAALAPLPLVESEMPDPGQGSGPPHLGGDINVTGGVTSMSPLEDSQLNTDLIQHSSSTVGAPATVPGAAVLPDQYPRSAARFREYFPRTSQSVMVRIFRAILTSCPGATDEEIAATVHLDRDQKSPGLWVYTMPAKVHQFIQRRMETVVARPKCSRCGDAGITWDALGRASWCAADCDAAQEQRHRKAHFVEAWNAQIREDLGATAEPGCRSAPGEDHVEPG